MIRTITFDDSTHKIVPREPTESQLDLLDDFAVNLGLNISWHSLGKILKTVIAAAPEYQEPEELKK